VPQGYRVLFSEKDEDYTFGYTESELEDALNE
jgi:hypothetical protein